MNRILACLSLTLLFACSGTKDDTSTTDTNMGTATTCAAYCTEYLTNCTDKLNEYADQADCETQCGTWTQGTMGDTTSNTLECRYYHAGAAASDAATHCPHAGPTGGGVCVD